MKRLAELDTESVWTWLITFARLVREEKYEEGARLFSDSVISFGTLADLNLGISQLMTQQWKNVWGKTRGFQFNREDFFCEVSGDLASTAVTWTSEKQGPDGHWSLRPGRATFILRRSDDGWIAVHSHLSLNPSFLGIKPPVRYTMPTSVAK